MNMKVDLCGVTLNNPVMTASGTFGSGAEYAEFVDLNKLGAVVTKGVANVPWPGNPTPRVAEVYGGMLNAVGLQNPGIDLFVERDIPFLKQFDTKIIAVLAVLLFAVLAVCYVLLDLLVVRWTLMIIFVLVNALLLLKMYKTGKLKGLVGEKNNE